MGKEKKVAGVEMFEFGDPEPVLEGRDILDMSEAYYNGQYYEPPVDHGGLSKSLNANAHHRSALSVKCNILKSTFIPHKLMSRAEFSKWALDFMVFGNGYIEKIDSQLRTTLRLKSSMAKFTRRTKEDGYVFARGWGNVHSFKEGSIHHLLEPDVNQEMYGVPQYLAGLQSAWLNEEATLFRRKYHKNGSHAGYIMYINDAAQELSDIENIRAALKGAKGPGNFKNMFLYAPNGKKDGVQIIPLSEVQAKDEFFNIKNVTRDDVLAAHRVPPQLMGMVPANAGGFGDVEKAARVFVINELEPLQAMFKQLNEWLGDEVVRFNPYTLEQLKESSQRS